LPQASSGSLSGKTDPAGSCPTSGGGTDSTARILQRYIEEQKLLPQPIAPVNVGAPAAQSVRVK